MSPVIDGVDPSPDSQPPKDDLSRHRNDDKLGNGVSIHRIETQQLLDDQTLSHADALAKTASESIQAIVRKRRILFAGFVARIREERLPQRVMFGELVVGKGYSGGQEKDWMDHLEEDMSVFGMKFEGWRKAAQKAGRCFRRVEEGAELFMRNWHQTERRKAPERRAKAAAAPSTVGISKRPGGGGRGGVMPKRLKSGFGHHRLESCGPSNGRH